MIFALLPRFLTPQTSPSVPDIRKADGSRLVPLLIVVGFLSLIGVLIFSVWPAVERARKGSPKPLDFRHVEERFARLNDIDGMLWSTQRTGLTRLDVEERLGSPTERDVALVERLTPEERNDRGYSWDRWIDPDDEERWVAVLYKHGAFQRAISNGTKKPD
jgi:hypothetical protein